MIDYGAPSYGDYEYPPWARGVGWALCLGILIWIPILAIYEVSHQKGSIKQVGVQQNSLDRTLFSLVVY